MSGIPDEIAASSLLSVDDVPDWTAFCVKLAAYRDSDEPSHGRRIWSRLPREVQEAVGGVTQATGIEDECRDLLRRAVNNVLQRRDVHQEGPFPQTDIPAEAKMLMERDRELLSDIEVQRLNRLLLETAFPNEVAKSHVLLATVKAIAENGLDIELHEGGEGHIGVEEIFAGHSHPALLNELAYGPPVSIVLGQSILVARLDGSADAYSRKQAVLEATDSVPDGEELLAMIVEITSRSIIALAPEGYELSIAREEAEIALRMTFGSPRLSPHREGGEDSPQLRVGHILDWPRFCSRTWRGRNGSVHDPTTRIWDLLPTEARRAVEDAAQGAPLDDERKTLVVEALNHAMKRRDMYEKPHFAGSRIPGRADDLLNRDRTALSDAEVQMLNRLLLESAYQQEIARPRAEDRWLYIHDRARVKVGDKLSESVRRATLVLRGTPTKSRGASATAPGTQRATVLPQRYSAVLLVDDDANVVDSLRPYLSDRSRNTDLASDLGGVHKWCKAYLAALKTKPDEAGEPLALVRCDLPAVDWRRVREALTEVPATSLVLSCNSRGASLEALQTTIRADEHRIQVLGVWAKELGADALDSVLTGQMSLPRELRPARDEASSQHGSPRCGTAGQPASDVTYHSLEPDCRVALEALLEAAGDGARPSAALLFRIHARSYQVEIVTSCGDEAVIRGFSKLRRHLHKSPIRDLAAFGQRSDIDDARQQYGRYIYFLDAMGGADEDLSVLGCRPDPPPGSPFRYAAFLYSRKIGAFAGNAALSEKRLDATRRAIEVALIADSINGKAERLGESAEQASDLRYMAHEVAGYLTRSAATLKTVERGASLDGQSLADIRTDTIRASTVLRQMLPGKSAERESFSPNEVISHFLRECVQLEQTDSISLALGDRVPSGIRVTGRRTAFECVIRNVVLNAVQQLKEYCHGQGRVRVDAECDPDGRGGANLVVTVSDDGPGIHTMHWDAVFEQGASTRREGIGLGLAVSRRLITEAIGSLRIIDSTVYDGTTFRMTLPVSKNL